jgi:membrane protease YdiL (CAAX protease family)
VSARRRQIVVGLLLSLGAGLLPLGTWGRKAGLLGPLASVEIFWWVAVAVVLLYVVFVERLPLSSIGIRAFGIVSGIAGVIAGVLLVVGAVVIYFRIFPLLHLKMNTGEMNKLLESPFWYRFALVTRAAVAEEVLFRGYPIERIEELSGRRWVAPAISWAAFTYAHLGSWGWA